MTTPIYDLHTISYSVQGWDSILATDMEKLDDVIQTRTLVTLESATEAYKALGVTVSGTYEKIIAVSGTNNDMIGISMESGSATEEIRCQLIGIIENTNWSWTIGGDVFLSDTISGSLTQSAPGDPQRIGIATSATTIFITSQDGENGATGATGDTGDTGATGPTGPAGEDAPTTLSGLTDTPTGYDNGKYLKSTAVATEWAAEAIQELGNTSIVSGTNTIITSFASNQADTDYRISANLVNTTDDPPSFYNYITSAVTVSGFTTLFNNNMDSSNYSLDWHILR